MKLAVFPIAPLIPNLIAFDDSSNKDAKQASISHMRIIRWSATAVRLPTRPANQDRILAHREPGKKKHPWRDKTENGKVHHRSHANDNAKNSDWQVYGGDDTFSGSQFNRASTAFPACEYTWEQHQGYGQ
jgi:hypothetical protein